MKKVMCAVVVIALLFSVIGWDYTSFTSAVSRLSKTANTLSEAISKSFGLVLFDVSADNDYGYVYLHGRGSKYSSFNLVVNMKDSDPPYQVIWSSLDKYPALTTYVEFSSSVATVAYGDSYCNVYFYKQDGSRYGFLSRTLPMVIVPYTAADAPPPASIDTSTGDSSGWKGGR